MYLGYFIHPRPIGLPPLEKNPAGALVQGDNNISKIFLPLVVEALGVLQVSFKMSGYNQDPRYGGQPETYWGDQMQQASSINFDMSGNNFGQELDFQSFDAQPPPEGSYAGAPLYGSNPYLNPSGNASGYHGDIFTPPASGNAQPGFVEKGGEFEEEPPLLEDLGISSPHMDQF
uniref:Uncharacterized protein n=1 Tax=Timema poppense TaxID=170557 RepID=A0A7R9D010_TIMPO|nr:unnamed protein product [Timema poppensis]